MQCAPDRAAAAFCAPAQIIPLQKASACAVQIADAASRRHPGPDQPDTAGPVRFWEKS